jgi:hypothetical protein
MRRLYVVLRALHLYCGLVVSPFILLFAASVFHLVHGGAGRSVQPPITSATVSAIQVPAEVARLPGRARVEALRPILDRLGVAGEVDFVRHAAAERQLVVPVRLPGRETTVTIDYERGTATVTSREQPAADVVSYLHKAPGPHNADIRGNAPFMRAWGVLADATVYALLFVTLSGVYLWFTVRAERAVGLALLAAGACSLVVLVYVIAG